MNVFAPALVLGTALASTVYADSFGPLVDPADLSASLAAVEPVILDIRGKGYEGAHIDGALSAPYGLFRGPASNPGGLVELAALEASLEQLGLQPESPIVIVSDGKTSSDFGAAARVYWTLKSTGFTDLSILNGGHAAWEKAGLPLSDQPTSVAPTELSLEFNDTWLATTADVSAVVDGKDSAVLVDARLAPFYAGEKAHKAAAKPGTLPGAVSHAFTAFFADESPAITPIQDKAALLATLGAEDGQEVISFCNTGHWAASHWFAVSELAGVENARLYAASIVEYSNAGLPMQNVPGLLENLKRQVGN